MDLKLDWDFKEIPKHFKGSVAGGGGILRRILQGMGRGRKK